MTDAPLLTREELLRPETLKRTDHEHVLESVKAAIDATGTSFDEYDELIHLYLVESWALARHGDAEKAALASHNALARAYTLQDAMLAMKAGLIHIARLYNRDGPSMTHFVERAMQELRSFMAQHGTPLQQLAVMELTQGFLYDIKLMASPAPSTETGADKL